MTPHLNQREPVGGRISGARFVAEALHNAGIDTLFTVPGGHFLPTYHEIGQLGTIGVITARHEQGAGYMASGCARVSGGWRAGSPRALPSRPRTNWRWRSMASAISARKTGEEKKMYAATNTLVPSDVAAVTLMPLADTSPADAARTTTEGAMNGRRVTLDQTAANTTSSAEITPPR